MNYTTQEIDQKLKELAYERTNPFCYSCYQLCPTGTCPTCGSDDLMRHLEGVGSEYGTDWVIENILDTELEEADCSENFEQLIEECYGETSQIGFINYSTVEAIKAIDPIGWNIAQSEYEGELLEDNQLYTCGSKFYWIHDVIELLE